MIIRNFTLLLLTAVLPLTAVAPRAAAEPFESDEQKIGYAIGYRVGMQLKQQGDLVDEEMFFQTVKDVLAGKESRMSDQELREAMLLLQRRMLDGFKQAGVSFLSENKGKEGVKETASGLQYKVLQQGDGKQPTVKDRVKVHYRGRLTNGQEFDSSYKRNKPAEFALSGVVKGWQEGIPLMKVGSKYEFYIPSELGYGARGGPSIPPHSVLVFEVELLDVLE